MTTPLIRQLGELTPGLSAHIEFIISQSDVNLFAQLSGDTSRIHRDENFAKYNGFSGPVVYGALIVARLSQMLGMQLPGDLGLATDWEIHFHQPLYVDELALLSAQVKSRSNATSTVNIVFEVRAGERLIAKGSARSMLLAAQNH